MDFGLVGVVCKDARFRDPTSQLEGQVIENFLIQKGLISVNSAK